MIFRRTFPSFALAVLLAAPAAAQPALTPSEFKCMGKASKAGAKFALAKTKCVTKCVANVWKGLIFSASDCFAPYDDPFVHACILDPTRGAEAKFGATIRQACDPTYKPGTDCPECFSGGVCDLGGEATNRVADLEGQLDSFFPGLFCETTPTPFLLEMRCMTTATKGVAKYYVKSTKCYDNCYANAYKGVIDAATCVPPAIDPVTATCLSDTRDDYIQYIDHDCGPPPASPDGCGSPYPTGEQWVGFVDIMVAGDVPRTYCGSPSGAFVD